MNRSFYAWIAASSLMLGVTLNSPIMAQRWGARRPLQYRTSHWTRAVPRSVHAGEFPNDGRYVGGFHSRYFESVGVPTGDIGIRGNGFATIPW